MKNYARVIESLRRNEKANRTETSVLCRNKISSSENAIKRQVLPFVIWRVVSDPVEMAYVVEDPM